MKFFNSILFVILCATACSLDPDMDSITQSHLQYQHTELIPKQVLLDTLADSAKPICLDLSLFRPPVKVAYPASPGNTYAIQSEGVLNENSGHQIRIETAPRRVMPFLKDEKDEAVLDTNGRPFILGLGGLSNFVTYDLEDFPQIEKIECGLIDQRGYLWLGTFGAGVSRFDGAHLRTFTTKNGLAGNVVRDALEDKSGNLWFATNQGVSKFDGDRFTNYTVEDGLGYNDVWQISEDHEGAIWFSTLYGGATRYKNGELFTLTTDHGLSGNSISIVREDNDYNLWINSREGGMVVVGPNRLEDGCFQHTCDHNLSDSNDIFIHNANISTLCIPIPVEQGIGQKLVADIKQDSKGNIWFSTWGKGLSVYRPSQISNECLFRTCDHDLNNEQDHLVHGNTLKGAFEQFDQEDGLVGSHILTIEEDSTGKLWFGTFKGLSSYDNDRFVSYTEQQGLANNTVGCIIPTGNGEIWLGTMSGLCRFQGNAFVNIREEHGLLNYDVPAILEDSDGNILFGTNCLGVSVFRDGVFTNLGPKQGLYNGCVYDMNLSENGDIWFGMWDYGLLHYDGSVFTHYTVHQGLPSSIITAIREDDKGVIWLGTGEGICKFNENGFTSFKDVPGFSAGWVQDLEIDQDGSIWWTTKDGLYKYDTVQVSYYPLSEEFNVKSTSSLGIDHAGMIWIGSYGEGLIRFDGHDFLSINKKQGLIGDEVYDILFDQDSNIWVGTENGLDLLSLSDANNHELRLSNLSVSNDSLTSLEISYSHITRLRNHPVDDVANLYQDNSGIIWISTSTPNSSVVRLDPDLYNRDVPIPQPRIEQIKIDDQPISWYSFLSNEKFEDSTMHGSRSLTEALFLGDTLSSSQRRLFLSKYDGVELDSVEAFQFLPLNLELPYRLNNLTIDFGGSEFVHPDLMRYQYRLDGDDNDWRTEQTKTTAVLGNIDEGSHTFHLRTRHIDGNWSNPITYTFRIKPPWFRTWWAYALYVLIGFGILRLIFFWRERMLKNKNEQLELTVKERTREVEAQRLEAEKQRKRSDELLLNILPSEIAEELKSTGTSEARDFDNVSVLFTDFKSFTETAEKLSAKELVEEINHCFQNFDRIIEKHNIEKIKTIGDAYMAAGGLQVPRKSEVSDVVNAAMEMQLFMIGRYEERLRRNLPAFQMRVGIHTGPVVAGIVGVKKFQYDIWGDTVNTASRMESNSEVGKVNISSDTYDLIKTDPQFSFESRGKVTVKGKGDMEMYFVQKKDE